MKNLIFYVLALLGITCSIYGYTLIGTDKFDSFAPYMFSSVIPMYLFALFVKK